MSDFDVKGRIVYTDEGATVALDKTTKAIEGQATAATKASDATKTASVNVGQFGSTVGVVGGAVGKFNAGLGSTVTGAGAALGAIQAMTTAGMGPLGIAIAVVSTAIAFFTTQQTAADAATKAFTDSLDANAASLDSVIGKMREQIALQTQRATLAGGGGTAEQYEGEARRLEAEYRILRERLGADSDLFRAAGARIDAQIARAREMGRAVEQGGAVVETTIEEGTLSLPGSAVFEAEQARTRGRRGAGGRARPEENDASAAAPDADRQREEQAAARLAQLTEEMDAEADVRRMMREQEIGESNAAKDLAIEIEKARVEGVKAQLAKEGAAREKAAKTEQQILSTTGQAHSLLAGIIEASAGTSEKAQKAKTQALAAASMIQSGIEMAVEIARAASSYPDVPGMVTHGLAAASFGVAIATAAASAGGGGAAAPSGGSGAPSTSTPGGGPSAPKESSGQGGNVYNITLGGSGVVYAADRNELMRTIADGVRAADTRRGR